MKCEVVLRGNIMRVAEVMNNHPGAILSDDEVGPVAHLKPVSGEIVVRRFQHFDKVLQSLRHLTVSRIIQMQSGFHR